MSQKRRLYVPLDVAFFHDQRMIAAGDGAMLLYLAMLCQAKVLGTDGCLSEGQIRRLGRRRWRSEIGRLVEVGAVFRDDVAGAYVIRAWHVWHEPMRAMEKQRAANRDRMRNARAARSDAGTDVDG